MYVDRPNPAVRAALFAAGSVALATTALPFARKGFWWIRMWDFPRLQIAGLAVLTASALLRSPRRSRGDLTLAAALGLAAGYQLSKVLPYTQFWQKQTKDCRDYDRLRSIRLLTANVLMSNKRCQDFLGIVEQANPDVICVLEPDAYWEDELRPLEQQYPHQIKCPLPNTYGLLLYSRLKFVDAKLLFRVEAEIPSAIAVVELPSGHHVTLHCLHPRPPLPFSDTFDRDAELVIVGRELRDRPLPAIVFGDLNDVAWSYTTTLFQRLSGLLDPRVGRGMFNSYHADLPLLRYSLDHVFHSRSFTVVRLERLPYFGSDHYPILAELCYEPQVRHEHPLLEPAPEDHEQAKQILADADRVDANGTLRPPPAPAVTPLVAEESLAPEQPSGPST